MSLPKITSGKVRDIYELDERHLVIVTSDRISAFDVVMNEPIPDRGRVLTALTEFLLTELASDLPNHLVSVEVPSETVGIDDAIGRSMMVRKAEMLPLELIVRGRLAGSGWAEYKRSRTLHGMALPGGMYLGAELPEPLLTPSTKGELGEHDVNLTYEQAAELVGAEVLKNAEDLAVTMYKRGAEWARECGLILADTKFELGYIDGELALCDEILTPDSSRYWPATGWEPGDVPPAFDKQVLRDWLEATEWDKAPPPPALPPEIVTETRTRYVDAYEMLTGRRFADWPGVA